MKKILLFLITLSALPAAATVKFVNGAAVGSNNGTTWANGWTNLNGIVWSGLAAGDTVCVAGGTYSGSITTAKSGTSGNPITVLRATAASPTCGSSTTGWNGAFDAQVVMNGTIELATNFVTIDGAVANGIKVVMQNPPGSFYVGVGGTSGPTNHVTLRNIEVAGPCTSTPCHNLGDNRSFVIEHWNGSNYDTQDSWLLQNMNLHGACNNIVTYGETNLIIEHSRLADSLDSVGDFCHPNVGNIGGGTATFRFNEVTNWATEGLMFLDTGTWSVYGNVWHDPSTSSFPRYLESQTSNMVVFSYNNTLTNIPYGTVLTAGGGTWSTISQGRNNIWWNTNGAGGFSDDDYDGCNGNTCGETHGQNLGTSTALFTNYATKTVAGYSLASNTAAGAALSTPFNTDLNGTVRGANGIWDRGYYQIPSAYQTWFVRADGGTRFSANVPTGQCDGLADVAYPGSGTNQHCSWRQFRYLWDDDSGVCPLGCAGQWVPAGGDVVVVRGCTANAGEVNPANPACRLGWDNGAGGGSTNLWCNGVGSYTCYNPTIPAGSSGQHTRILGGYAYDHPGVAVPRANMTQLFGGFSLQFALNFASTSYVDFQGIELTTHNGACSHHGSPAYPRGCSTSPPLDDYSDNGILTNNATANILFQDVYIDGFESNGTFGPIGGVITWNRANVSFNMQSGMQFDDGVSTPDAAGSQLIMHYVTGKGNGCKQEYPIVHAWPALACWDDSSGGFGDFISGQNTELDVLTFDHGDIEYNTKDAFIGPHTQVQNLTVTNSFSAGNMGAQMKNGATIGSNVLFQNNLFVMNPYRQTTALPGAAQNFNQSTGLGGSYLTDFGRAGGDGWSFLTRASSTNHYYGNTVIGANPTMMDINCGFVDGSGVHEETNCGTSPLIWTGNNILGFTDPIVGQQPGLWFFDPGAGGSLVLTASYNNYFGVRNISPDVCGTNHITCVDPQLVSQPVQAWPGSEAALDVFNAFAGSGNSFYPTSGSPIRGAGVTIAGLTTDYYGTTRPSPPAQGGIELGGVLPVVATPTCTPIAGTYSTTQSVTCSSTTPASTTYCTVNGSTPTTGSPVCTGISVASTLTLKAISAASGFTNSSILTQNYTITVVIPPVILGGKIIISGSVIIK